MIWSKTQKKTVKIIDEQLKMNDLQNIVYIKFKNGLLYFHCVLKSFVEYDCWHWTVRLILLHKKNGMLNVMFQATFLVSNWMIRFVDVAFMTIKYKKTCFFFAI